MVIHKTQSHRRDLASSRFEAAQHLRHEAGIDVGALDGLTGGAGDLKGLHQLGWCAAPKIEFALSQILKAKIPCRIAGITEAAGVTDQTKHSGS